MEIDWKYNSLQHAIIDYRCENCGSGLIDVRDNRNDRCETNFFCRSCGKELSFEEIAPLAISEYFSGDNYLAIKDGDYPVTILCPLCGRNTYVLDEDVCVMCDESVERECQRCGIEIPPSEIDGEGYCDWCAHMMSKDD
jgi:ssDNA-binding Zn-finger/Zn-ribbon topoisomerase 1